jgi:predicted ATP-binding protein involved in virulence
MQLRRLEIENFRGITKLDLAIWDTTVLIGENNTGKTAVLDALRFALRNIKTGRQVGAVQIPSRTTAVPMTFMHMGRQYIVFATGAGENTSLVALSLPRGARRPTNSGGPGN